MKIAVGFLVFELPPDLAAHVARAQVRRGHRVRVGPSWSTALRPPR